MAQTKRKRRSKHRGTPAGTIEARGRTGRKPTAGGRSANTRETARERRTARLDRPPSWRSAATRGAMATVVFFVALLVILKPKGGAGSAALLAIFMLLVYIPMGYYTDLLVYRRRQRAKAKASSG